MFFQTVDLMKETDSVYGSMAAHTLKRLNACRGSFTFDAALALVLHSNGLILPKDDDDLDEALDRLQQ